MSFIDFLKRQAIGPKYLPRFRHHVTPSIVSLHGGSVVFGYEFTGSSDLAKSEQALEMQFTALNGLFLTLAKTVGARLAIWSHLVHDQGATTHPDGFKSAWMRAMAAQYAERFTQNPVFENRFFLTFVLQPGMQNGLAITVRDAQELQRIIYQTLRKFAPQELTIYYPSGDKRGVAFSRLVEFLAYLYNGFWENVPVGSGQIVDALATSSHYFSYDSIETRSASGQVLSQRLYDLKDCPETTVRGMLRPLLEQPFAFVWSMSLALINNGKMLQRINAQITKMESAQDAGTEQHDELVAAKGGIMSGILAFGEFHASLAVKGALSDLDRFGSDARGVLSSQCGVLVQPAQLSAPGTFLAQMPGCFSHRPRVMDKATTAFTGLLGLHQPSQGKAVLNPIGDGSAVVPLQCDGHGVFYFNMHPSEPGKDVRGQRMPGHTLIFGATGAGKTTLQTVLLSFASRFDYSYFAVDKDQSMRGFIEAHGGAYFSLKSGVATGLNPFQLPDTPANRELMYSIVTACAGVSAATATAEDVADIQGGVDGIFQLPREQRRFGVVVQNIPDRGANCIARRLAQWVYGEHTGRFAYALDNESNSFEWASFSCIGFDVTDFLVEGHPATEPILAYLLHLKKLICDQVALEGGRLAVIMEEFWIALAHLTTANQILDILKTGRKRFEDLVLVTQSPEDASRSPLMPTIVQQTPTKIFLANPDAEFTSADGGGYSRVGMTEPEFELLRTLTPEGRRVMIKQRRDTVLAHLDLTGMENYISLLAMSAAEIPLLERAKAQAGSNPDDWIPHFFSLLEKKN